MLLAAAVYMEEVPREERNVADDYVFRALPEHGSIPDRVPVMPEDADGNTGEESIPLASAERGDDYWLEDVKIMLTFRDYGADAYLFGGENVPAPGPDRPDDGRLIELVYEALDKEPSEYRIRECSWAGEPYTDAQGRICRDAEILGARKVSDITAHYEGTICVAAREETAPETAEITGETEEAAESAGDVEEIGRDASLSARLAGAARALAAFLRVHRIFTVNLVLLPLLLGLYMFLSRKKSGR